MEHPVAASVQIDDGVPLCHLQNGYTPFAEALISAK
jgi:hypothetical protein